MAAVFNPEEPSPPLTPEREAARQWLNDEERKILEAMERDLDRPLTDEEEHLALEPGVLIEAATQAKGVSHALSIFGRIGDLALDAVLIYVVFRLIYVVWRLQRAIRVGTSALEHFFTEIETLRARIDALEEKHQNYRPWGN